MEVALTFGSLGDIIAVCQIAIQLGRALGAGQAGASSSDRAYQALRKNLRYLRQSANPSFLARCRQVVATYEQHDTSSILVCLTRETKTVVDECGTLIQQTLDLLMPRYEQSLRPGGSRNWVRGYL
ncbi:hypothetical protein B0H67DRAFT_654855 [Lasiosphaeris hirsuta]|uniref:Uncharacterized protein n=1 Tax=Lasiosphaeris hirsuta TaxID=260670 RepID=A0AA40BCT4_9PEZI|nr:hypothetical protein B0H67DRAFT_654855 [Lasiosphaeris hirsuta]